MKVLKNTNKISKIFKEEVIKIIKDENKSSLEKITILEKYFEYYFTEGLKAGVKTYEIFKISMEAATFAASILKIDCGVLEHQCNQFLRNQLESKGL